MLFTLWDFCSEEDGFVPLYEKLHRALLTSERSIYLITFNASKIDVGCLDYWVQSVTTYGNSAPILLIGTHADLLPSTNIGQIEGFVYGRYSNKFKNVFGCVVVSIKTLKNLPKFKTNICEFVAQKLSKQPNMGDITNKTYFELEQKILDRLNVTDTITSEDLNKMILDLNIKGEEETTILKDYAHNIGIASSFSKEYHYCGQSRVKAKNIKISVRQTKKSKLNNGLIILNPDWLFNAIKKLKKDSDQSDPLKNAIINRNDIQQIWSSMDISHEVQECLIELLLDYSIIMDVNSIINVNGESER